MSALVDSSPLDAEGIVNVAVIVEGLLELVNINGNVFAIVFAIDQLPDATPLIEEFNVMALIVRGLH